jgi:hypothetical protein
MTTLPTRQESRSWISVVSVEVVECRYHNLPPLKWIHNHLLPAEKKNAFMDVWFKLEELINDDNVVREKR